MSALHLGIVVDSASKQQSLAQLVVQSGHRISCQLMLPLATRLLLEVELDAWIVDVAADYDDDNDALDYLFAHSRVPIILSDSGEFVSGSKEHQAWLRRTGERLQHINGDINLQQANPANELWILAASTGGPAAVKRFFSELPANLGIAFIYVQHIDASQSSTLNRMMTSAGSYVAMTATQGAVLEANSLTLITARDKVEIRENGTLAVTYGQGWNGSYAPSIDQVAANAARIYRKCCGLIIFTGMGDDGTASCRLVRQLGGKVWVQTPADCTSDSMPLSALATGCTSFTGTPEDLASAMAALKR